MSENKYIWVDFYTELADKLLPYRNNRAELVAKIKTVYEKVELKLPKLEEDGNVTDIDPFSTFGLFNKGITNENRIKIISGFADEFSVTALVPQNFDGIPVLNNQKATFYGFGADRGEHDIDTLWETFASAIEYSEDHSATAREKLLENLNAALKLKGVKWNITMGLFWIRPQDYINLDVRNRWFISQPEFVSAEFAETLPEVYTGTANDKVPSAEIYLAICKDCREAIASGIHEYKSFPELSVAAWGAVQENDKITAAAGDKSEIINALSDDNRTILRYWMYAVYDDESWKECEEKEIIVLGMDNVGDYSQYASKKDIQQALIEKSEGNSSMSNMALMAWNFSKTMKINDVVFVRKANTLVGKGIVTGEYAFADEREQFKNIRSVKWLSIGEWENPVNTAAKRLTDITSYTDEIEKLNNVFASEQMDGEEDVPSVVYPPYTAEDFLKDVYMEEKDYRALAAVLLKKKNIILQGAPGVGKTFAAKRLAYSIIGAKNTERVMMVQFHQSYSYEDFVMGFRPSATGFELKKGAFYNFCKKAEADSDNQYFFIIDEINRGNLSKIFGELFMLIETDKRGIELQLLYSDEKFAVPANVYLIGMMNTADRSLALLDYALRRRFAFIELKPGFDTERFLEYRKKLGNEKFNRLVSTVESLNTVIAADDSLGEGFCIGHSYFCNLKPEQTDDQTLNEIVEFELIPLLKEYWFDESAKVKDWSSNLRSAIK